MKQLNKLSGFTLLELILVMGLIGIVLGIGIPSMEEAISNSRMTTQANDLLSDINYARNAAISRGTDVIICRSNAAQTTCGADNKWEEGWIVFADQDENGSFSDVTPLTLCAEDSYGNLAEDCLLKKHQPFNKNSLRYFGFNSNIKIVFDARGFSAGYNGTFTFCDDRGNAEAKYKTLNLSGRLKTVNSGASCT